MLGFRAAILLFAAASTVRAAADPSQAPGLGGFWWAGLLTCALGAMLLVLFVSGLSFADFPLPIYLTTALLGMAGWLWATGFTWLIVSLLFWTAVAGSLILIPIFLSFFADGTRAEVNGVLYIAADLLVVAGWATLTGYGDVVLTVFYWTAVAGSVLLTLGGLWMLERESRRRFPWTVWVAPPSLVLAAWFWHTPFGWLFLLAVAFAVARHLRLIRMPGEGPSRSWSVGPWRSSGRGSRGFPFGDEGGDRSGGYRRGYSPPPGWAGAHAGSPPPPPQEEPWVYDRPHRPPAETVEHEPRGKDDAIRMARELFAAGNRGGAARALLKAGFSAQQIEAMMEVMAREEPPGGYA